MDFYKLNYPLIIYIMIHFSIVLIMVIGFFNTNKKLIIIKREHRQEIPKVFRAEKIRGRAFATMMITILGEIVSNTLLWIAGIFELLIK